MKNLIRYVVPAALFLVLVAVVLPVSFAQQNLPTATIACSQYMRTQPNSEPGQSAVLAVLQPDEPVMTVTGRDEFGEWLVVRRQNGQVGWVFDTECVVVQGSVLDAPWTLPATYEGPPVATVGCTQYVRSAASEDSTRLLILYPGDGNLEVIGRNESGEWLLIRRGDGAMGWVFDTPCIATQGNIFDAQLSSVVMPVPGDPASIAAAAATAAANADPNSLFSLPPTPTPVPGTPVPPVPAPNATIGCTQYLRSAARNDAARLLILYPSDGVLQIIGRDWVGEWLLVRRLDGAIGWVVNTPCIVTFGNVFDAPVTLEYEAVVPEPAPTATPLPFPGYVPPTPTPEPIVSLPEEGTIPVNCNAFSGPVTIREDRWVVLEFPLVVLGSDELTAWYNDSEHQLTLDGDPVEVGSVNEMAGSLVNPLRGIVYGGYRVPIGQLEPGQHEVYWIARLPEYTRFTVDRAFAPGSYDFACTIFVEPVP